LVAVSFPALKHFRLLELIHSKFPHITASASLCGAAVLLAVMAMALA
jgi:hypothetical protein